MCDLTEGEKACSSEQKQGVTILHDRIMNTISDEAFVSQKVHQIPV
jgi:hypothetical protein